VGAMNFGVFHKNSVKRLTPLIQLGTLIVITFPP
jgi:hypothetical protein